MRRRSKSHAFEERLADEKARLAKGGSTTALGVMVRKPWTRCGSTWCHDPPGAESAVAMCVCVLIPTLATKTASVCRLSNRQAKSAPFQLHYWKQSSWGGEMERSLLIEMTRDKYVERCRQRAFDHLDRGDLKNSVASFVGNMNARPDCELPHYLSTLGASLLTANDALGWRTLIEGLR